MSVLRALAEAAEAEFFRGLRGTNRGILRAIGRRDRGDLTIEDYDIAISLIAEMLTRERDILMEGRAQDALTERRAVELAETRTLAELKKMVVDGGDRAEMVGDHRRTSAAVHNEGRREAWTRLAPARRAIEIKEGVS